MAGFKKRLLILIVSLPAVFILVLLILPAQELLDDASFSYAVYDRNGELLRVFLSADEKYRIRRSLNDFPSSFVELVLLKEDRYFYAHPGVNPVSLFKAVWTTYVKKERRIGASTITMQLVRLQKGLYTRSIPGKVRQIMKALYLELKYSKQEILEAYLNLAPCGGNIEGYPAAAYYFFHKNIRDLTLSEMLFLAVLPQDPSIRAPKNGEIPAEAIEARKQLFSEWIDRHPQAAEYTAQMIMPVSLYSSFPFLAPHAAEYLRNRMASPGSIQTTIDLKLQNLLEEHLKSHLHYNKNLGVYNGSALLLDYSSMEVLAAVGSADFFDASIQGQVNGFNAKRSPGSMLKPFIYALAMEQGLIHPNTMLKDAPASFGAYTPDNYQSDFKGPVKAWEALVHSRNIPAITLAEKLNNPDLLDFLAEAGIHGLKDRDHYGLSIVLGSAELTMLEMVKLFAVLPNKGLLYDVTFFEGRELPANPRRLLSKESSYLTMRMLQKNPSPLEYRPKEVQEIPIAYKTGTSIGFKDCWSIASFDKYVLCVWIGNFNGDGNPAFLGRKMAAPLLFSIADSILINIPEGERHPALRPPLNISQVEVCSVSGGIPNEYCPKTIRTGFIPGISPISRCKIHRRIYIDTRTGYRTTAAGGESIVPVVREFWPSDLLEQFQLAGLPRLVPPPLAPSTETVSLRMQGVPPRIISPLSRGVYVMRLGSDKHRRIPLIASVDADVSEVFWFADNTFIGKTKSEERFEWEAAPGDYTLTVLDDIGRSSSIELIIEVGD